MDEMKERLESLGLTYLPPAQGNQELVAMFNPVQRRDYYHNYNYQDNVQKMAQVVNQNNNSKDIFDNQQTYRLLNSSHSRMGQDQMRKFQDFSTANQFFTFDIETLGNALHGDNFSISEIAVQGFQRNGNKFKPSNQSLTLVGSPSQSVQNDMIQVITQLRQDPYQFNKLEDWKKRTLVDLTRYSTRTDGGVTPAVFESQNGNMINFGHNSLANTFFKDERMIASRVIEKMSNVLQHAESGLENLSENKYGLNSNQMIDQFNKFVHQNNDSYFISYNGDSFDIPKLKAFGEQAGNNPMLTPNKHLDYFRVIQTTFPNPLDLHRLLNQDASRPSTGMTKLQAFRSTLGYDTEAAHSATHDIGLEGLAGVIQESNPHIQDRIQNGKTSIGDGFNFQTEKFSWNDAPVERGQTLFALGGVRARRDGELSFAAKFDPETGVYNPINDSFNTTIINAKTFYDLEGIVDLSDGNTNRYGLKLYDQDRDLHNFIIREGDNALHEIQDFMQNRFYNWDGLDKETRRRVSDARLTDSARRQYERLFSLEKAGTGRTGGFNAAQRTYQNAKVLEERLSGKDKNIQGPDYHALRQNRITHESMMEQLRSGFDSLWNPETKSWVKNEREMENFFRMGERLISERPAFEPALKYIESHLSEPTQRDLAWNLYTKKVNEAFPMAKETIPLQEFENRRVGYTDFNTNTKHSLDMSSWSSTEQSISRYVYSRDISQNGDLTPELREDRYRERMNQFLKTLQGNDVINENTANELINVNNQSATVRNAIIEATDILQSKVFDFDSTVQQTSLGYNNAIQQMDLATNEIMFQEAVKQVRSMNQVRINPQQVTGSKVEFSPEVERALQRLDQSRLSGLSPNNRQALESVLSSVVGNSKFNQHHVALSMDQQTANARISIYNPSNSTSVTDAISSGQENPNALSINVPLVGEHGVHQIGNRRINARRYMDYQDGQFVVRSSTQQLADNYTRNMNRILRDFDEGDIEGANNRARRVLNESLRNLSGIQRNLTSNDSFNMNNNQSDFFKQGNVEVDTAMVKDLYARNRLTNDDFYTTAFEGGRLRPDVSVNDLKPAKAYEVSLAAGDWLRDNNLNLFAGTNKGEHVSQMMFNELDIREFLPYGHYTFQGRDNSVQLQNAHLLNAQVQENILNNTEGYVSFNELVATNKQREWVNHWRQTNPSDAAGMQIKTAFINDGTLMDRINSLSETEKGLDLLREEGIINTDGSWNHTKIPRIYEQQGLIAQDLQEQVKVTEQKILSETDNVTLFRNSRNGDTVQPGQAIGYEMINGHQRELRYQGPNPGTVIEQNGRVGVAWEEDAFKYIVEGEKMTDVPISRRLMSAITGDDSVSMILNPNIKKHRDYGMFLSGKAKILADYAHQLSNDLVQATIEAPATDKASSKALRRMELETQFNRTINLASTVGLHWDANSRSFIQEGNPNIPANSFENIFEELGLVDRDEQGNILRRIDQSSLGDELAILEARVSKVSNHSKMIDETGRIVLEVGHDRDGNITKKYRRNDLGQFERGGVSWGHREMGVFKDLNLTETYNKVYETMMTQAQQNNRLNETKSMIAAISGAVNENHELVADASTLNVDDFRSLPEIDRDTNTYQQTIFDRDYIERLHGNNNAHGFWLELPGVQQTNGDTRRVTANINGSNGERQALNRIFIPFTNLEGANGEVHLRELQRSIGDIYRRAADVVGAGSIDERARSMDGLQGAVDRYFDQTVKDITSSKGQTGSSVLKASMPSSGSGLFKLLDPSVSMALEGEFTFISPDDAKALGVYDKLKTIEEQRVAGKSIDDLMVMNTRYPVFHSDAVQISKLRVSEDARKGEFLTTSWQSDLMKADSDGDYNNIVVLDDDNIQKEWRRQYNLQEQNREQAYLEQLGDSARSGRGFNAEYVLGDNDAFRPFNPNTQEEMAAKIGKRVVGSASNLNLYMRQVADQYLNHGSEERRAIYAMGQDLEQKLISSKHGLTVEEGRAPAIEMINSVYNNNFSEARKIQQKYFKEDFNIEMMEKAFSGLSKAYENLDQGLYNPSLKFGTSRGLNTDIGLKNIHNLIQGEAAMHESVQTNSTLRMLQNILGVDNQQTFTDMEGNSHVRVDPYESRNAHMRSDRLSGMQGAIQEYGVDLAGGSEGFGNKLSDLMDTVNNNRNFKWGIVGAGLALGALGGYNILRHKDPIEAPQDEMHYTVNSPPVQPAIDMNQGGHAANADISVNARGGFLNENELAHMINQGMVDSQMNPSNPRITINTTDNTQQLNRFWYRDKIEENV